MELVSVKSNDINANAEPDANAEPNAKAILSPNIDKIATYNDLLQKVIPFIKSDNILEKKAAYDLNILLKCGINKTQNDVIMYLHDAIDHLIQYFMPDLNLLINNQINLTDYHNQSYQLLHDLVIVIMQTVMHKRKIEEFRKFCLQI
jgi:hypothetical protein